MHVAGSSGTGNDSLLLWSMPRSLLSSGPPPREAASSTLCYSLKRVPSFFLPCRDLALQLGVISCPRPLVWSVFLVSEDAGACQDDEQEQDTDETMKRWDDDCHAHVVKDVDNDDDDDDDDDVMTMMMTTVRTMIAVIAMMPLPLMMVLMKTKMGSRRRWCCWCRWRW